MGACDDPTAVVPSNPVRAVRAGAKPSMMRTRTRVVNKRSGEPYDIYVGRPSRWGNPYSHRPGTLARFQVSTREEAITKYEHWLITQPALLADLRELKGKTLACWCAPPGGLTADDPLVCHGQVLARLADALPNEDA